MRPQRQSDGTGAAETEQQSGGGGAIARVRQRRICGPTDAGTVEARMREARWQRQGGGGKAMDLALPWQSW